MLAPGKFFRERTSRETGQSIGVIDGVLHARFKDGEHDFLLGRVPALIPLPDDDLRSMCAFAQEDLREFAVKNPCGFIEACVRAMGPCLTYRDLRTHILEVVPSPWSTWWNKARPKVKRSAWVEMSGTAQPTFELRKAPLSHEIRVQAEFDEAETLMDQLLVILDYLGEAGDHVADEEDLIFSMGAGFSFLAGEDQALDLGVAAVMRTIELAIPGILEGLEVPELFVNARGANMTRSGFEYILAKHVKAAVPHCTTLRDRKVSPHQLRHSCNTDLWNLRNTRRFCAALSDCQHGRPEVDPPLRQSRAVHC